MSNFPGKKRSGMGQEKKTAEERKKTICKAWMFREGSSSQDTVSRRCTTGLIPKKYAKQDGTSWQILRCSGYGLLYLDLATQHPMFDMTPKKAVPGRKYRPKMVALHPGAEV